MFFLGKITFIVKKLPSATIKCPKIGHFYIRKTFFEQAIAHDLRAISYVIKKLPPFIKAEVFFYIKNLLLKFFGLPFFQER